MKLQTLVFLGISLGYFTVSCGSTLVNVKRSVSLKEDEGLVALFVDTNKPINALVFTNHNGLSSIILNEIPHGNSLQLHRVKAGQYCLSEIVSGIGAAGGHFKTEERQACFTVKPHITTYQGHFNVNIGETQTSMNWLTYQFQRYPDEAKAKLSQEYSTILTQYPLEFAKD